MTELSLQPDERMEWIYDQHHPDHNTEKAQDLRARRAYALRNAPQWMIDQAKLNDEIKN